jgi:hypothetical protein
MKIFKQLKKLGYIHYSATTIEELDDLPINSSERILEQALVFKWFREKYNIVGEINSYYSYRNWSFYYNVVTIFREKASDIFKTYEEAEFECLIKLIKLAKLK